MEDSIDTATTLMGVGMITVFVVLFFVVIIGNLLILLVNKFIPAPVEKQANTKSSGEISSSVVAAITTAVEVFTKGTGKITSISKKK